MINGVDEKMAERLPEQVHDLPIELHILAHQLETNVLAHSSAEVAKELRERRSRVPEGNIGQSDRLLLNIPNGVAQPLQLTPPGAADQVLIRPFD